MNVLLIQVLVFGAVFLLILGLNALLRGKTAPTLEKRRPGIFAWFPDEIATVGRITNPVISALFPEQSRRIEKELVIAALDSTLKPHDIRGLQCWLTTMVLTVIPMFVLVATLQAGPALLGGLIFGFVAFACPPVWLSRVARQRQDLIAKELPFAIDLLTVAIEAGQDFGAALRSVVAELRGGPLRAEFVTMLRETEMNKSRLEALRSTADRIQLDEFRALVTSVAQSTELGASVAVSLKLQAEQLRRARFHRAERKAARAPSLMLFPAAVFILPAVFIVILTPVAIRMFDTLHGPR